MRMLARAHQQLIWDRVRQTNRLRSALREYFPGALEAFPKLATATRWGCWPGRQARVRRRD